MIHCNFTVIKFPFISLNFIFTIEDNNRPAGDRYKVESILMEMTSYNSVNHSFPVEKVLMDTMKFKLRVTSIFVTTGNLKHKHISAMEGQRTMEHFLKIIEERK